MELRNLQGGLDGRMSPAAGSALPYPPDVAQVLSYLANLIDRSIDVRGTGTEVRHFAAGFLGVSLTELVATTEQLRTMAFQLAGLAFADELARHPPVAVIGEDAETPPRWEMLHLGDLRLQIPYSLAGAFTPGTVAPCPLVVFFDDEYEEGEFTVTVYSRRADAEAGGAWLSALLERSRRRVNPFRHRVLESTVDGRFRLTFRIAGPAPVTRADVVLPPDVWAEVDRNVHGFLAALDRLKSAGLACNRGLLLEGPPGTGKTALCRVLAAEVTGVTVIFCDAQTIAEYIRGLYREVALLTPAIVVMEDVDLIIGNRRHGASGALNDFLLALDGAMAEHAGVITMATTNDVEAIDEAARRSARFDRVVRVPAPDAEGRAAILRRYLRSLDHDVDVHSVARASVGMTGADLREVVSLAVLDVAAAERAGSPCPLGTDVLLRIVRERGPAPGTGLYL